MKEVIVEQMYSKYYHCTDFDSLLLPNLFEVRYEQISYQAMYYDVLICLRRSLNKS